MDNNINFKDLWAKQSASQPDVAELHQKARQLNKSAIRRVIFINLLLFVTSAFIIGIWIYFQPQMLSTKIGIVLVVLAMGIFVVASNQSVPMLKKANSSQNNSEFLKNLLAIKSKQQFLQTYIMNLYFILLSTGIFLYMYEYASRMTKWWEMFAYGITMGWIAFNWFYFRPRQIRKQNARLNGIISKFEMLNKQLDEK